MAKKLFVIAIVFLLGSCKSNDELSLVGESIVTVEADSVYIDEGVMNVPDSYTILIDQDLDITEVGNYSYRYTIINEKGEVVVELVRIINVIYSSQPDLYAKCVKLIEDETVQGFISHDTTTEMDYLVIDFPEYDIGMTEDGEFKLVKPNYDTDILDFNYMNIIFTYGDTESFRFIVRAEGVEAGGQVVLTDISILRDPLNKTELHRVFADFSINFTQTELDELYLDYIASIIYLNDFVSEYLDLNPNDGYLYPSD